MKRSVSSFLGTVSNVLSPLPDDDDQEAVVIKNDAPVPLSRFQVVSAILNCLAVVWSKRFVSLLLLLISPLLFALDFLVPKIIWN